MGTQFKTTRAAFQQRQLGFADAYLIKVIDYQTAKQQCEQDITRVRDRFELHFCLQPFLILWYEHLEEALGGGVLWTLPDDGLPCDVTPPNELRYDIDVFDRFVSSVEGSQRRPRFTSGPLQPTNASAVQRLHRALLIPLNT